MCGLPSINVLIRRILISLCQSLHFFGLSAVGTHGCVCTAVYVFSISLCVVTANGVYVAPLPVLAPLMTMMASESLGMLPSALHRNILFGVVRLFLYDGHCSSSLQLLVPREGCAS